MASAISGLKSLTQGNFFAPAVSFRDPNFKINILQVAVNEEDKLWIFIQLSIL